MCSATVITVRFVGTEGTPGRIEASITRRFLTPRTASRAVDHSPFVVVAAHGDGGGGVLEGGDLPIDRALEATPTSVKDGSVLD